ncbi:MAG: hypothetical protein RLZZ519_1513 [Bacteroidota bacterium]
MKSKENIEIPTHSLESAQNPILLRSIDHKNHYDFTKVHRHSYFEVMFFIQGGGTNLIDFHAHEVKSNSCYLIYPGQIHLLNRAPGSFGSVIQFTLGAIESPKLQRLLQEKAWSGFAAVVFEEQEQQMKEILPIVEMIGKTAADSSKFRHETKQHLLQALLFTLFSLTNEAAAPAALDHSFYQFLQLIDLHFKTEQTVAFYLDRLTVPEKKLAALAQKFRGLSPLQIIHQRILLEAKRMLATGNQPHKEIAYELGFDSPASFSAFIKKKTGLTASEIQAEVAEIHIQKP